MSVAYLRRVQLVQVFLAAVAVAVGLAGTDLVVLGGSHKEGKVQEVGSPVQVEDTSLVVRRMAFQESHQVQEDRHDPIRPVEEDRMVVGMGVAGADQRKAYVVVGHAVVRLAVDLEEDLAEYFVVDVVEGVGLGLVEDEIRSVGQTWSAGCIYYNSINIVYIVVNQKEGNGNLHTVLRSRRQSMV